MGPLRCDGRGPRESEPRSVFQLARDLGDPAGPVRSAAPGISVCARRVRDPAQSEMSSLLQSQPGRAEAVLARPVLDESPLWPGHWQVGAKGVRAKSARRDDRGLTAGPHRHGLVARPCDESVRDSAASRSTPVRGRQNIRAVSFGRRHLRKAPIAPGDSICSVLGLVPWASDAL